MLAKKNNSYLLPERSQEIAEYGSKIGEKAIKGECVDILSVLNAHDIELCVDHFGHEFDGLLELVEDLFILYCNKSKGNYPESPRGRFTIAHELGHFFIDEHRLAITQYRMPSLGEYAPEDILIEREADLFASRLLLPNDSFKKASKKVDSGLKGILSLAERFKVSVKCAAIRYISDDSLPCAITFRTSKKDLVWKWISRSLWLSGYRKIASDIIKKGATDMAFTDLEHNNIEKTAAPAKYLFQLGDGSLFNEIFFEEAVRLDNFGVITFLRSDKTCLPLLAHTLENRV